MQENIRDSKLKQEANLVKLMQLDTKHGNFIIKNPELQ